MTSTEIVRGGRTDVLVACGGCPACLAGARCTRPLHLDQLPTLACTWCAHHPHAGPCPAHTRTSQGVRPCTCQRREDPQCPPST